MNEVGTAVENRPQRELESIIEGARVTYDHVSGIANRLRDMRRRLLGMDEGSGPAETPVKEAVGSELSDLRATLGEIDDIVENIETYVSNLEGI